MTSLIEQIGLSGKTNNVTAAKLAALNHRIGICGSAVRMLDDLIERHDMPRVRDGLSEARTVELLRLKDLKDQREGILSSVDEKTRWTLDVEQGQRKPVERAYQRLEKAKLDRVIDAADAQEQPVEQDTMNFVGSAVGWEPSGSLDQETQDRYPSPADYGVNYDAHELEAMDADAIRARTGRA